MGESEMICECGKNRNMHFFNEFCMNKENREFISKCKKFKPELPTRAFRRAIKKAGLIGETFETQKDYPDFKRMKDYPDARWDSQKGCGKFIPKEGEYCGEYWEKYKTLYLCPSCNHSPRREKPKLTAEDYLDNVEDFNLNEKYHTWLLGALMQEMSLVQAMVIIENLKREERTFILKLKKEFKDGEKYQWFELDEIIDKLAGDDLK